MGKILQPEKINMNDQAKQYQQIIAKCWADESFKQQLMADPATTLKQEGINIPHEVTVNVCENTEGVFHFVIPARPDVLDDDSLDELSGGWCCSPEIC